MARKPARKKAASKKAASKPFGKAAASPEARLNAVDVEVLKAAGSGGTARTLTDDEWTKLQAHIAAQRDATEGELEELLANCPYDTRLAVTAWVFRQLCAHAREGGSFRHLIYDRLDFGLDAYATLYIAGGMSLSNLLFDAREKGILPVAPGDE